MRDRHLVTARPAALATAAALALGVPALAATAGVPSAQAHSVLTRSEPAEGSTGPAPTEVRLTFNEDVNSQFASVTVLDGERHDHASGQPAVAGPTVSARVDALAPGPYVVGYRVTSADGHVVQGRTRFTVAGAEGGGPAASPEQSAGAPSQPAEAEDPDHDSTALYVVGGLAAVLVVLAGVVAVLVRRARR